MGNYLVTGAAGFIGARTAELLIRDGHTVVGVDNGLDGASRRSQEQAGALIGNQDIRLEEQLTSVVKEQRAGPVRQAEGTSTTRNRCVSLRNDLG